MPGRIKLWLENLMRRDQLGARTGERKMLNVKINLQAVVKVWTGLAMGQITHFSEQSNEQFQIP